MKNNEIEYLAKQLRDAAHLTAVNSAIGSQKVDICVIRHPIYLRDENQTKFNKIFSEIIPNITKPNTPLAVSFYKPSEYNNFAKDQLLPVNSPYLPPTISELKQTDDPKFVHKINELSFAPDNIFFLLHFKGYALERSGDLSNFNFCS